MRYTETVEVYDPAHGTNRIVKATVECPSDVSVLNLQELTQKAWDLPLKKITRGRVSVRVEKLKR
jgi:divalent metal cation (Fe/Co/Zn/Cd) transporter